LKGNVVPDGVDVDDESAVSCATPVTLSTSRLAPHGVPEIRSLVHRNFEKVTCRVTRFPPNSSRITG